MWKLDGQQQATQSKSVQPEDALEVGKEHLDLLSFATRAQVLGVLAMRRATSRAASWMLRDAVKLMARLIFLPIAEQIESGTYLLYDGACGTGGN